MTTELATREPVSLTTFDELRTQASMLIKTGFLPQHIKTPEQAVAVILIGREMGVPMMQALRKIYVIQGTPAVAPELLLAMAYRTGEVEDLIVETIKDGASVTIKRLGKSPVTQTFTLADAAAMNLASKDNWRKQAGTMCRWRALSACLRLTFPDVCLGFYTVEELRPDIRVSEEGEPLQKQDLSKFIAEHAEDTPPNEPESSPDENVPDKAITLPQAKRFWSMARSCGWTEDEVKSLLKGENLEHVRCKEPDGCPGCVPRSQYDHLCILIEQGGGGI